MFPLEQKQINIKAQKYRLFLNQRLINKRIQQIAVEINQFYEQLIKNDNSQEIIGLCILKTGFLFFTDLVKKLNFYLTPQFLSEKKIHNFSQKQQNLQIKTIKDRHVLVVMSFIDQIAKMRQIQSLLKDLGAKSVNFCVLICKKTQELQLACKWIGFSFINLDQMIGYGFAKDEFFRPLNQIYMKSKDYEQSINLQKGENPQYIL